jgi:hypothetical protein
MRDHEHHLLHCSDCDGGGCSYCNGRGFYEICSTCREPMGNLRRKWKAAGRPRPWTSWAYGSKVSS